MYSIIEILDNVGIDSQNMQNWIEECQRFRLWHCKTGTQEINEVAINIAYLKIIPLKKTVNYGNK